MSCGNVNDFCVELGETFHPVFRWATSTITSVPISAITQAAPAVVTTTGNHGLPNGWPCAVVSAQGMTDINARRYPPQANDLTPGTVLSSTSVQLNAVNSADFATYTSGGFLVYNAPAALTGVSATMTIWDNPNESGTPLATLTSTGGQITIDLTLMTMVPLLQTAALTWTIGYYRFDVTDGSGIVTQLSEGSITLN